MEQLTKSAIRLASKAIFIVIELACSPYRDLILKLLWDSCQLLWKIYEIFNATIYPWIAVHFQG